MTSSNLRGQLCLHLKQEDKSISLQKKKIKERKKKFSGTLYFLQWKYADTNWQRCLEKKMNLTL